MPTPPCRMSSPKFCCTLRWRAEPRFGRRCFFTISLLMFVGKGSVFTVGLCRFRRAPRRRVLPSQPAGVRRFNRQHGSDDITLPAISRKTSPTEVSQRSYIIFKTSVSLLPRLRRSEVERANKSAKIFWLTRFGT